MLTPLSWLYGKIINKRNEFYEGGTLKSTSLGVPTISVGNITVGGTGKTPLVAQISEFLAEKGENVCIISRGYKRENEKKRVLVSDKNKVLVNVKEAGDEPFELANKLLGKAYVVADADRVKAGHWAKKKFGITAFVLDDAFQHRKVQRDLDIVVIDASKPFGNYKTLPAGILRESIENLKRADLFIITRANLSSDINAIKRTIKNHNNKAQIISARNKTEALIELQNIKNQFSKQPTSEATKYFAFCALGNPDNFFNQLLLEKYKITDSKEFRDHYFYTQEDVKLLEKKAYASGANAFITTYKDAVKLIDFKFQLPCYVSQSKIVFEDKKKLHEIIHAVFS